MTTRVARMCVRCNRYRPIPECWRVRDGLGYRYVVCASCIDRGSDRVIGWAR